MVGTGIHPVTLGFSGRFFRFWRAAGLTRIVSNRPWSATRNEASPHHHWSALFLPIFVRMDALSARNLSGLQVLERDSMRASERSRMAVSSRLALSVIDVFEAPRLPHSESGTYGDTPAESIRCQFLGT